MLRTIRDAGMPPVKAVGSVQSKFNVKMAV